MAMEMWGTRGGLNSCQEIQQTSDGSQPRHWITKLCFLPLPQVAKIASSCLGLLDNSMPTSRRLRVTFVMAPKCCLSKDILKMQWM